MEGGVEVTVLVRPGTVWKFEVVVVVGKRRILWRPVLFVVAYDRKGVRPTVINTTGGLVMIEYGDSR